MGLKICLLSDHHICLNPRLWKEAFYFEKKGFEVVILIKQHSEEMRKMDLEILQGHAISYKAYLNLIQGEIQPMIKFYVRARRKFAGLIQKHLHIGSAWAINYAPKKMLKSALRENADLYVAHLESAFYVGRTLIRKHKKVAFDFEDWYSRDYLVPERPVKLLSELESFALQHAVYCTSTSQSMADAIQKAYSIRNTLTVIYNGFETGTGKGIARKTLPDSATSSLKLLWFSRTIGPNRGIEFLVEALKTIPFPIELHLLGEVEKGYTELVETQFPFQKGHTLIFHPFIAHNKLENFISKFDIGLAIEENINDNKILTISNKMLQYLQAGLPVLATSTKGQIEVANDFQDTVRIVDIQRPESWGAAIIDLMAITTEKRMQQIEIYNRIYSWEAQERKFDSLLQKRIQV